jgi:hypothetical protein
MKLFYIIALLTAIVTAKATFNGTVEEYYTSTYIPLLFASPVNNTDEKFGMNATISYQTSFYGVNFISVGMDVIGPESFYGNGTQ